MTLRGAIRQLHELRSAEDMPIYYKPVIAEVINVLLMDTEPVRHGCWKPAGVVDDCFWVCSSCGFPSEASGANILYKYCPNCGAKMEVEE